MTNNGVYGAYNSGADPSAGESLYTIIFESEEERDAFILRPIFLKDPSNAHYYSQMEWEPTEIEYGTPF